MSRDPATLGPAAGRAPARRRWGLSPTEGNPETRANTGELRDVAYSQIPRAERGEKHRAAAVWIEGLGRTEDQAEMLAHHYLQALELAKASGRGTRTRSTKIAPDEPRVGRPFGTGQSARDRARRAPDRAVDGR